MNGAKRSRSHGGQIDVCAMIPVPRSFVSISRWQSWGGAEAQGTGRWGGGGGGGRLVGAVCIRAAIVCTCVRWTAPWIMCGGRRWSAEHLRDLRPRTRTPLSYFSLVSREILRVRNQRNQTVGTKGSVAALGMTLQFFSFIYLVFFFFFWVSVSLARNAGLGVNQSLRGTAAGFVYLASGFYGYIRFELFCTLFWRGFKIGKINLEFKQF